MYLSTFYSYRQYSKLKRVRSYGDGIYHTDKKDTFVNDAQDTEHTVPSDQFDNVAHSNCVSCQKQFTEDYKRKTRVPSLSSTLNSETEQSSLSMLIWDQNQKPICPSYNPISVKNESKMAMNNGT